MTDAAFLEWLAAWDLMAESYARCLRHLQRLIEAQTEGRVLTDAASTDISQQAERAEQQLEDFRALGCLQITDRGALRCQGHLVTAKVIL